MSKAKAAAVSEMPLQTIRKVMPIALLIICTIGTTVSGLSTWDHVRFRGSGGTQKGACAALIDSGCQSAHSSKWAEILGIPISHFGSAFYLAGAGLAVLAIIVRKRRTHERVAGAAAAPIVTVMGIGAVAYSVFLAMLLFRSGEACPFCISLYVVNVAMLLVGLGWWSNGPRRVNPRALLVPGVVTTAVGGGVFAITTPFLLHTLSKETPTTSASASAPKGAAQAEFVLPTWIPSKGVPNAEDELIEFSDLDCPHCALMHRTVSALFDERGPSRLRVRFVNYPLDQVCNPQLARSVHPTACLAARGAICAQEQSRFWQYADAYFASSQPRSRALVLDTAESIGGLDMDRFGECLDAEQTGRALAEHVALSKAAGVRATPTVLVNGLTYEGALPREQLQKVLIDTAPCGCDQRSPDGACAPASVTASIDFANRP